MSLLSSVSIAIFAGSIGTMFGAILVQRLCAKYPDLKEYLFGAAKVEQGSRDLKQQQSVMEWFKEQEEAGGTEHDMGLGLSVMLAKLFPYTAAAIEAMIHEMMPPMLDKYKPKWMESIEMTKFSLGSEPPVILKMRVDSHKSSATENEIRIIMSLRWVSNTDIQLFIKPLPANLKFIPGFLEKGLKNMLSLHAGVSQIMFDAKVLVTLAPMRKRLPVAGAMQVCMLTPPSLDFTMSLSKDSDESKLLKLVKPWLLETIKGTAFAFLTLPENLHIPIELGAPNVYRPHGILKIRVQSAGKVPSQDLLTKSDPYCKFWVRPRVVHRTSVQPNCYYPDWNHDALMLVHDKKYQYLMMELWDDDSDDAIGSKDDFIGSVCMKLADVPDDGTEIQLKLPVCSEAIDTTKDPNTLPIIPGDKDEGGVCRLNFTLQWIDAASIPKHPSLGQPGCFQVAVKKLSIRVDAADSVFPLGLYTTLLGKKYESPFKWKQPKKAAAALDAPKEDRIQLFLPYVAPFDLLGTTTEALRAATVTVTIKGGPKGLDVSGFALPLADVFDKLVPGVDKMFGGSFVLSDRLDTITATMDVWWHGVI